MSYPMGSAAEVLPEFITGVPMQVPVPKWITGFDEQPLDLNPPIPQLVQLNIETIDELVPFLEPHRYKVAYGGRGSSCRPLLTSQSLHYLRHRYTAWV